MMNHCMIEVKIYKSHLLKLSFSNFSGKLILRLERNHLLYAGEDWNINDFSTYHAR